MIMTFENDREIPHSVKVCFIIRSLSNSDLEPKVFNINTRFPLNWDKDQCHKEIANLFLQLFSDAMRENQFENWILE